MPAAIHALVSRHGLVTVEDDPTRNDALVLHIDTADHAIACARLLRRADYRVAYLDRAHQGREQLQVWGPMPPEFSTASRSLAEIMEDTLDAVELAEHDLLPSEPSDQHRQTLRDLDRRTWPSQ
ncbi:hypothetical protein BOQ63_000425 (plasmid) [Streptomyces viridifaciens]|nr:hypothetical protein BOQ63_000425 [Streptomyces viridifaciens]